MVVIVIVGFCNAQNVRDCLRAVAATTPGPDFQIFVAENGGSAATDQLLRALTSEGGPCRPDPAAACSEPDNSRRVVSLTLLDSQEQPRAIVHVAEMQENCGYAGGVNAWLRALAHWPDWTAVWVLNPDTEPTPEALGALVAYAASRSCGMVGSRLVPSHTSPKVQLRGLAWNRIRATTTGVDCNVLQSIRPAENDVETRLDSPSGASMYVSRAMIETIGLMDDGYFLYFEDLDWGLRAKALGTIGYAHGSVVGHQGGTTIRTSAPPAERSRMAVYLMFRNQILFVRRHYPRWMAWTVLVQFARVAVYAKSGARSNTLAAAHGLRDGLRGETGPPRLYLREHRV